MKHPGEKTIGWALAHTTRLRRLHLNQRLSEIGLFAGQEQIIQVLEARERLSIGEMANLLRVRIPTASKAVTRLAALGFVTRHTGRNDARMSTVRLTSKGRSAAARIRDICEEVERNTIIDFLPQEAELLHQMLTRAATNLATLSRDQRSYTGTSIDCSDSPTPSLNNVEAHAGREPMFSSLLRENLSE